MDKKDMPSPVPGMNLEVFEQTKAATEAEVQGMSNERKSFLLNVILGDAVKDRWKEHGAAGVLAYGMALAHHINLVMNELYVAEGLTMPEEDMLQAYPIHINPAKNKMN